MITAGGIDLSVGSMAAFIAGMMIIIMNAAVDSMGASIWTVLLGIGCSLILGIGAGFINGFRTTKGKIEAFIVTLGSMGIYRSLITYFADGGTLSLNRGAREIYRPVYYDSFIGLPYPVWVFIIVALLGWVLMNRTAFGRYCMAIGSNEQVARSNPTLTMRDCNDKSLSSGLFLIELLANVEPRAVDRTHVTPGG